jgi:hypothetical protein
VLAEPHPSHTWARASTADVDPAALERLVPPPLPVATPPPLSFDRCNTRCFAVAEAVRSFLTSTSWDDCRRNLFRSDGPAAAANAAAASADFDDDLLDNFDDDLLGNLLLAPFAAFELVLQASDVVDGAMPLLAAHDFSVSTRTEAGKINVAWSDVEGEAVGALWEAAFAFFGGGVARLRKVKIRQLGSAPTKLKRSS